MYLRYRYGTKNTVHDPGSQVGPPPGPPPPLPPGWAFAKAPNGRAYYYARDGRVQWERPRPAMAEPPEAKLSVKELTALLRERGVDTSGAVEEADLVRLALASGAAASANARPEFF